MNKKGNEFCLKWSNHQDTLIGVFDTLLGTEKYADCILTSEGKVLRAHKVVLSACSPHLEFLLNQQGIDKHPILVFNDIKYNELKAMLDYMYKGEVSVPEEQLTTFLKAAKALQLRGLSDKGSILGGPPAMGERVLEEEVLKGKRGKAAPPLPDDLSPPGKRKRKRRPSQEVLERVASLSCEITPITAQKKLEPERRLGGAPRGGGALRGGRGGKGKLPLPPPAQPPPRPPPLASRPLPKSSEVSVTPVTLPTSTTSEVSVTPHARSQESEVSVSAVSVQSGEVSVLPVSLSAVGLSVMPVRPVSRGAAPPLRPTPPASPSSKLLATPPRPSPQLRPQVTRPLLKLDPQPPAQSNVQAVSVFSKVVISETVSTLNSEVIISPTKVGPAQAHPPPPPSPPDVSANDPMDFDDETEEGEEMEEESLGEEEQEEEEEEDDDEAWSEIRANEPDCEEYLDWGQDEKAGASQDALNQNNSQGQSVAPPMDDFFNPTTKRYHCNCCGKSYLKPKVLLRHRKFECVGIPRSKCDFCSFETDDRRSLLLHKKKHHRQPSKYPQGAAPPPGASGARRN